ncbi:hypothetical protein RhiirA5_425294, partial [Rhizophagus irregularis]
TLDHLWTCPYILPEFSPFNTFKTLLLDLQTIYLENFLSATPLKPLPDFFIAEFTAIDCWECNPPSNSCLRLARELILMSLTSFLGTYFSPPNIWSILDTPLYNFHFDLYIQIWLCRSVFFHHWESAQGITNKMKSSAIGPSSIFHPSSQISLDFSTPSLLTVSLDSWISWVSKNSNSKWPYREIGGPFRLSNDFSYNRLGRHIASLDLSHSKNFRDINRQRENYVSFEKSGTASKDHNDDRTNGNAPLSNCESNMRMLSRKGKDNEIYVQCFNLLQISTNTEENENQQCLGNKIKKGKDANIAVGFRNCPNSGRINELQSFFGELRRVGIMGSVTWRNELPREACHLVHAYPCPVKNQVSMCLASESVENDVLQQDCKNILMVVETFSNKQVCRRVASSYGYKLPADSCDPRELVSYIKQ